MRLIGSGGVLAVYTSVLQPAGLLDRSPTVLGLRTFAAETQGPVDSVVPIRALLDRLARLEGPATGSPGEPVGVLVPPDTATAPWRDLAAARGWQRTSDVAASALRAAARPASTRWPPPSRRASASRSSRACAARSGAAPWRARPTSSPAARSPPTPRFLGPDPAPDAEQDDAEAPVAVFRAGPWTRLTTARGHVLVRRL
ncbi:hypothetical protein BC477_14895 [Clavibacter michiganensis subsp. michiganensis]|nr:hypothetical protein BC477_14895 [Clavibacter michiganensis subsp. michiganensis]